jgi:putative membrane protein
MPDHFWDSPLWWFPIFMSIFWVIVIALCLYFIFGRRRRPWGPGLGPEERQTALDILKKRYAKGEISKDEFEQMKRDISG